MRIYVVGAGGHAQVVQELALSLGYSVVGLVEKSENSNNWKSSHIPIFTEEKLLRSESLVSSFANGVPRTPKRLIPLSQLEKLQSAGFSSVSLISPRAYIAESVIIKEGIQVFPGAIVQSGTTLGDWVLVNSGAIVEHHVEIGQGTHVAPGAVICGGVDIGPNCFIGAGSILREGISIAENSIIGAGAVVTKNIPSGGVFTGNPARRLVKE